ncbi:MAG: alpha/beta hydrolase [Spirochaetales bacterium]|nr:alpha/beta hydrolase [Spirochaetales bacterium]
MNPKIVRITLTFITLALVVLLSLWFLGRLAARNFSFCHSKTEEELLNLSTGEFGHFKEEWLRSLPLEDFTVTSPLGYDLQGHFIRGEGDKTIVMCHGHTYNWIEDVKFMPLLLEEGWNIVVYNHRYHGTSGGDFCSAGYFEKQDLKLICDWAWETFPQTTLFGIQGESMGAATVLQYLPMDDRLDFVWADCPYSDMADQYSFLFKKKYHIPTFLHKPIIAFCDRYLKKHCQFDTTMVSPREEIMKKPVPLLLVHGAEDTYVPTSMSIEMYEKRKDYAPTELLLIEGADHAEAIHVGREIYEAKLREFFSQLSES